MLDIRLFRDDPDAIRLGLARRGEDPTLVDDIRSTDTAWRESLAELEALRAERNEGSKSIAGIKDAERKRVKIEAMRLLNEQIKSLESAVQELQANLDQKLLAIPNLPADAVPEGENESDNPVVKTVGQATESADWMRPHWDLGPDLGLIDFERGTKLSGSRFYVLMGAGARLQRALIGWLLDFHTARGYQEVYPPFIVREACMWSAGQLPKFKDNLYRDVEDDLWLIPTAEVPLTNLHVDEILGADQLPIDYVAYTPCFRREKMSAGRDVRGIKRGHQFDKVEMYKFTLPERSPDELQRMLSDGEAVLQALNLPYRVVELCTGDLGFGATRTYDLEAWAPGCGEWLEVSSISDFGSFQARRAGIRFRREQGAPTEHVHTLNGSGLGIPRTMIAIMENYQTEDGRIRVPEVLQDRVGAEVITGA